MYSSKPKHYAITFYYILPAVFEIQILYGIKADMLFPENEIYKDNVAVNPKKIQDMSKVRQYMT